MAVPTALRSWNGWHHEGSVVAKLGGTEAEEDHGKGGARIPQPNLSGSAELARVFGDGEIRSPTAAARSKQPRPVRSSRGPFEATAGPLRKHRGPFCNHRGQLRKDRGPIRHYRGPFRKDRGPF
jgi:hypothetical protein